MLLWTKQKLRPQLVGFVMDRANTPDRAPNGDYSHPPPNPMGNPPLRPTMGGRDRSMSTKEVDMTRVAAAQSTSTRKT